jgi:hypothetical protein
MKRKNTFGIASLAVVALLMVSVVVSAYVPVNYLELYEDIQNAIEDNDYDEWKSLVMSTLTEENFDKLVEEKENQKRMNELTRELMEAWEEGDKEKIEKLEEELRELSNEIYGGEVDFMASDGAIAISRADSGSLAISLADEENGVKTPVPVVRAVSSGPVSINCNEKGECAPSCKVGEECEAEIIEIEADFVDEGHPLEETDFVVVKDSRSFWDAFRFW